MTRAELIERLKDPNPSSMKALMEEAYRVKRENLGPKVFLRGLVEVSNLCSKNCYYCGIRRENGKVHRYRMSDEEVFRAARWTWENRYGSLVLQGGEVSSPEFVRDVTRWIEGIVRLSGGELGITLSLGEQSLETYRRWYDAGAHRYLLRIETSSPELYGKLHPQDHSFKDRVAALERIREAGFQVGTGVMMGLPFQSLENMADDILFFQNLDIDMIGMGPYIPHQETPLPNMDASWTFDPVRQLSLGLKMIALTRLQLPTVNIASTTALEALHPEGRERGLLAGANVIMPQVGEGVYRKEYLLYEGKPVNEKSPQEVREEMERRLSSIGAVIGYGEWGDSLHARNRGAGARR